MSMDKVKVTADISSDLVAWIDERIADDVFATRTQAISFALRHLMRIHRSRPEEWLATD